MSVNTKNMTEGLEEQLIKANNEKKQIVAKYFEKNHVIVNEWVSYGE